MDYSSESEDEIIQQYEAEHSHHHSILSEIGKTALDIGKGVATAGIASALF